MAWSQAEPNLTSVLFCPSILRLKVIFWAGPMLTYSYRTWLMSTLSAVDLVYVHSSFSLYFSELPGTHAWWNLFANMVVLFPLLGISWNSGFGMMGIEEGRTNTCSSIQPMLFVAVKYWITHIYIIRIAYFRRSTYCSLWSLYNLCIV